MTYKVEIGEPLDILRRLPDGTTERTSRTVLAVRQDTGQVVVEYDTATEILAYKNGTVIPDIIVRGA